MSDEGLRIIRDGSHPDHSGHMSRQMKFFESSKTISPSIHSWTLLDEQINK